MAALLTPAGRRVKPASSSDRREYRLDMDTPRALPRQAKQWLRTGVVALQAIAIFAMSTSAPDRPGKVRLLKEAARTGSISAGLPSPPHAAHAGPNVDANFPC
jgi:hypothetical protein